MTLIGPRHVCLRGPLPPLQKIIYYDGIGIRLDYIYLYTSAAEIYIMVVGGLQP